LGKDKIKRFRELESIDFVVQPEFEEVFNRNHPLKGQWKKQFFRNGNPLVLELGCGRGEYTVGLAVRDPEKNYLGVDIKGARIWKGAVEARDRGLTNVGFLRSRIDFISSFFDAGEVDDIWITFPDPQEKLRRRKKRLTGDLFLNRYRMFLADGGLVRVKTDNAGLFAYTSELARYNGMEVLRSTSNLYASGWEDETTAIRTTYENRFLAEGKAIHYIEFRLSASQTVKPLPYDVEQ